MEVSRYMGLAGHVLTYRWNINLVIWRLGLSPAETLNTDIIVFEYIRYVHRFRNIMAVSWETWKCIDIQMRMVILLVYVHKCGQNSLVLKETSTISPKHCPRYVFH